MLLKPGMLLSRKSWPKEIILYLQPFNDLKNDECKGILVLNHLGKYDGRVIYFVYDCEDYVIINNSKEYLSRIKDAYL